MPARLDNKVIIEHVLTDTRVGLTFINPTLRLRKIDEPLMNGTLVASFNGKSFNHKSIKSIPVSFLKPDCSHNPKIVKELLKTPYD